MIDHVSDLQWDRLLVGDLPADASEAARVHADQCVACSSRLRELTVKRAVYRLQPIPVYGLPPAQTLEFRDESEVMELGRAIEGISEPLERLSAIAALTAWSNNQSLARMQREFQIDEGTAARIHDVEMLISRLNDAWLRDAHSRHDLSIAELSKDELSKDELLKDDLSKDDPSKDDPSKRRQQC